jgi:hypothetical protein
MKVVITGLKDLDRKEYFFSAARAVSLHHQTGPFHYRDECFCHWPGDTVAAIAAPDCNI